MNGSGAGNTYIWDVATGHIIATFSAPQSQGVYDLAYSPRGTTLVTSDYSGNTDMNGNGGGKTYLWNVATRRILATLTDPHSIGANGVAYSHKNQIVATGRQ